MKRTGELCSLMAQAKIYDLAQPLEAQIPFSGNHPGFRMALLRRHGDMVRSDGGSASNEIMIMGGHSGTHLDALCHVSQDGFLHDHVDAAAAQRGGCFTAHGIETIPPMLCRGVMLDIAGLLGADVLPSGMPISADHLSAAAARQKITVQRGDALLIHTGWSAFWKEPVKFIGHATGVPGPDESAARWMVEQGIRIAGAETIAFECINANHGHALLPVHRILLVEAGIYIMEAMNLSELASQKISEFLFVLTPLKVVGATGVPVRPLAVKL